MTDTLADELRKRKKRSAPAHLSRPAIKRNKKDLDHTNHRGTSYSVFSANLSRVMDTFENKNGESMKMMAFDLFKGVIMERI